MKVDNVELKPRISIFTEYELDPTPIVSAKNLDASENVAHGLSDDFGTLQTISDAFFGAGKPAVACDVEESASDV